MTKCRVLIVVALSTFVLSRVLCSAQESSRTKVAEGEYRVTMEGDLGVGPIETEIFHFRETWTLWRTASGFDLEGHRTYESPLGTLHNNRFIAKLAPDLQVLSMTEFAPLAFRSDSGPLTCDLQPHLLRCDSGAKDPAQRVNVQVALDRPYGLIWPLSAFSLASLTRAASERSEREKPATIQVVQLEEISDVLPVLPIRSDGLIRYLGQSQDVFGASGQSWHPRVYELTTSPIRKMTIWTSPEGLLLAADRPSWPKAKMELVNFKKFADF